MPRVGICRLTGERGPLVASHIIPKALTKVSKAGLPQFQLGGSRRPIRRWSSWYDRGIVTGEGEKILSDIDSVAIRELRKHRMVWSGWGPMQSLVGVDLVTPIHGIRGLKGVDHHALRLFFLSLVWRAAVSGLVEFDEIRVPDADWEELRCCLCNRGADSLNFYPVRLTQLSTLGAAHNLTPFPRHELIPPEDGRPAYQTPTFRFYFDGLVAHIHRGRLCQNDLDDLGTLVLGSSETVVVLTVPFEYSFQRENGIAVQMGAFLDAIERIPAEANSSRSAALRRDLSCPRPPDDR